MQNLSLNATQEQRIYAKCLEKGMWTGLIMIIVIFALYIFRFIDPVVPVDEISKYWAMPIHDYLLAVNNNYLHRPELPVGWSWINLIGKGDFMHFLPIAILSGVTIFCYIAIIPGLFRRGDKTMGVIAFVEVLILGLAASGLLAVVSP